jgi:hypothetical protein
MAPDGAKVARSLLTASRVLHCVLCIAGIVNLIQRQLSYFDLLILCHLTAALSVPEMVLVSNNLEQSSDQPAFDWVEDGLKLIGTSLDLFLKTNFLSIDVTRDSFSCTAISYSAKRYCGNKSLWNDWFTLLFCALMDTFVLVVHLRSRFPRLGIWMGRPIPIGRVRRVRNSIVGLLLVGYLIASMETLLSDLRTAGVREDGSMGFGALTQILSLGSLSIQINSYMTSTVHVGIEDVPRYKIVIGNGTQALDLLILVSKTAKSIPKLLWLMIVPLVEVFSLVALLIRKFGLNCIY